MGKGVLVSCLDVRGGLLLVGTSDRGERGHLRLFDLRSLKALGRSFARARQATGFATEELAEGGGGDDMQFAHSLQQMMVAEEVAQRHATTSPVQKKKGKTGFRLSSSKKPTIEGYLRKRGQKGE